MAPAAGTRCCINKLRLNVCRDDSHCLNNIHDQKSIMGSRRTPNAASPTPSATPTPISTNAHTGSGERLTSFQALKGVVSMK